jgi:hypothetical protein
MSRIESGAGSQSLGFSQGNLCNFGGNDIPRALFRFRIFYLDRIESDGELMAISLSNLVNVYASYNFGVICAGFLYIIYLVLKNG